MNAASPQHTRCCVMKMLLVRMQACNKPQKVDRDAYDGPAMDIDMSAMNLSAVRDAETNGKSPDHGAADFHQRPPTRSGGRHMQDSTFAFSGT